ncbi:VCBS repeat-containing protein [Fulvivirgaceae bacterium BMA10]|uniref:VCBS repeat-containing protein n=1 Tax=Splendidivirga corallicola TaxID=3051826 RepID=A0ABT8KKA4_9BACT|nr:VCBS repeat-containing protein [Fulvivirgaceae bacterium BMA10]
MSKGNRSIEKRLSFPRMCLALILCGQMHFVLAQSPAKLFTLLKPEETNITFVNEVRDERHRNVLLYENYYSGGGVGVGDFNQDGLFDLYFTGNINGDRLYLNKGDFTFEDVTIRAGITDDGGWSSGVSIVDINQDGLDDIYVCKEMYDDKPLLRKNKLYINNGDLTFTESASKYGLDDSGRSRQAVFFDYDKDKDLDLFLLNSPPEPGKYSNLSWNGLMQEKYAPRLYENKGTSFEDVSKQAGVLQAGFPNSASAADLNNDGWVDIYVANDFRAPDFLYLNNGDGTFTNIIDSAVKHISNFSMGVDVADMNNDGLLDIYVLDMAAEDNYRSKANMSGMNPQAFQQVVDEGGHYQYMFNTFQLNQGNNHFSDIAQLSGLSSTDWSWSNLLADFDNDGLKDVYVTNGIMREIRNTDAVLKLPRYAREKAKEYVKQQPNTKNIHILDILDIEETLGILPSQKLSNYAYRNNGDLTFANKSEDWGLDRETFSNGSAYADLDNDGDLDLIVNNINESAHLYRNNSEKISANNHLRVKLSTNPDEQVYGTRVIIKYADKQQLFEFTNVRGMFSCSEQIAHFGLGQLDLVDELIVTWPDETSTFKKNVKVNQLITIKKKNIKVIANRENRVQEPLFQNVTEDLKIKYRHLENQYDDFKKQVLLPHKMSQFGPGLGVADVNGDKREDFFIGGAAGYSGKLYLQTSDGGFQESPSQPWIAEKGQEDIDAVFFDFDNDGDNDLYIVSGGNEFDSGSEHYQDRLYRNDGEGNFELAVDALPQFSSSGSRVVPADFDNDGDMDLFVGGRLSPHNYPMPTSSFVLRNEGGKFNDVTQSVAPELKSIGMVTDAVWTDFDLNGTLDLIVVGEWMPVTFFSNNGSSFENVTSQKGIDHSSGWWFGIEKGDFDNDGDDDLMLGNLGLNYKYKASPEEPFEVYYDDFDNNESSDIVLSYYNFGSQYPVRGKSCSSEQIPALRKKYKTYDAFASSDLKSIYGELNLKSALNLKVETFASLFLENLGNGEFRAHQLPNEAQLSNINDIIIDDFNNDGHLDALMAGNLYVSEVETPRNDAGMGVLLLGDGSNNFEVVPPMESGFYAPYDVKNMRLIRRGKERLLILANNDEYLQIIRTRNTKNFK